MATPLDRNLYGACSRLPNYLSTPLTLSISVSVCLHPFKLASLYTNCCRLTGDEQWSQTGDRYLLKLFQDYLFHQVLPSGAPWVDLAHVVQTLNKVCQLVCSYVTLAAQDVVQFSIDQQFCSLITQLDAGSQENVMLHSRDEQSVLLVSFSDLKACLETTFSEVLASNK